nr:LPD7 domain-containing protein [Brevundimonas diminuta]
MLPIQTPQSSEIPGSPRGGNASSIDRSLSAKALTDRLGTYRAQFYDYGRPQQTYNGAVQRNAQARRLHADYRTVRMAAERGRAAAMAEVNTRHDDYAQRLREHYRNEKAGIRTRHDLRGPLRREALGRVEVSRKSAYAERDRLLAEDRATVKAAHPVPTWQVFLEEQASRGDGAALSALRSRTVRRAGAFGDIITAEDLRVVQDVLYQTRMPTVMRNGDVVYQTPDGGRVTDRAAEVRTDTFSRDAAFLALALASDRFPGQPLVVEGSPTFRAAVLEMSLHPIFKVTFADPELEKARRSVAHEEERNHPAPEPGSRATPPFAELRCDDRLIQIERERGHSRGLSAPDLSL